MVIHKDQEVLDDVRSLESYILEVGVVMSVIVGVVMSVVVGVVMSVIVGVDVIVGVVMSGGVGVGVALIPTYE